MILYDKQRQRYYAAKCKRPKINLKPTFRYHFEAVTKSLDGKEVQMWYQPSYGKAFYFSWGGAWYRLPFGGDFPKFANDSFSVSEFFTKEKPNGIPMPTMQTKPTL